MKKINFNKILCWYNKIDKVVWKDKIDVSSWFASCILTMCAIIGAYAGGISFLNAMLETDLPALTLVQDIEWLLLMWAILVGESITCGNTITAMVTRSLFMIPAVALIFLAGYILSVVVLGIITLVIGLVVLIFVIKLFVGVAFGGGSSSKNGKRTWRSESGETLTESGSGILGESYAKDSHGNEYKIDGDSATKL